MTEKTYLYSVYPRKTVTGLHNVPGFRSPKSLYLTLEDVKICLEKAVVHRRFTNENKIEKVTLANYERLHNDKFMTEKEYEEFKKSELGKNSSTVSKPQEVASTAEKNKVEAVKTSKLEETEPIKEEKEPAVTSEPEVVNELDAEIYECDEDEVIEKAEDSVE